MSEKCQQRSLKPTEQRSGWLLANSEAKMSTRAVFAYPTEPLVSYQINRQLSGVDSSSTGDPRLRGALPTTDIADAVRGRSVLMVRCPCRSQGNHGIRVLASSSYQTLQLVRAPVAQL
jgi:hypothetical protein